MSPILLPPRQSLPRVATIGLIDPRGVAGLALDVRTLAALGVGATTVATAIRLDLGSGSGRAPWHAIPERVLSTQLGAALARPTAAVKVAAIGPSYALHAIAKALPPSGVQKIIVDAGILDRDSGLSLDDRGLDTLRGALIPIATLVMCNTQEAEVLTGRRATDVASMREACKRIAGLGVRHVLITGGRLDEHPVDVLFDGSGFVEFGGDRISKATLRGAGTVLGAAICGHLAKGLDVPSAIDDAKRLVTKAIATAIDGPWGAEVDPLST